MAVRITLLIRAATGGDHPARGALTRWAERVGTSTSSVTRWRGGTIPDPEWWPKLAEALDVSEDEVQAAASGSSQDATATLATIEATATLPAVTATAIEEPTNAALDAKLDQLISLVKGLGGKSKPKRAASADQTPSSMPRPALRHPD